MEVMNVGPFLLYLQNIKRYSPKTVIAYEEDLNQFFKFCKEKEGEGFVVTSKVIRNWVVSLMDGTKKAKRGVVAQECDRMSPTTVRRKLSTLRTFFRYQMREGIVTDDPTEVVIAPKVGKRLPVFVSDYQMGELLDDNEVFRSGDFHQFRDRLVLLMAYCTGMRCSELVGMKIADIDFGNQCIRIDGKGNKQRIMPMVKELSEDMGTYLDMRREKISGVEHGIFFITDKGTPVYEKFIYRLAVKYLSEVSTLSKRSPHVLRHTFATTLLNNGACIEAIRELLGHASLAATQIYTHNSFENLKEIFNRAHPHASSGIK